ncbi:extracellular solute-binding protein, partial [Candidatus Woesebacteria bacterium]|nr:extracellular solute-binding protein [Candidatus Woesebacteria bacterium]
SIPPEYPTEVAVYEQSTNKGAIIAFIIVFFLVVLGLVYWFFFRGPSPSTPPTTTKEPVTLSYWGLWDDASIVQPIIEEYQKANPHVTIAYEKMSPESYIERLIARSKTGNGPDIFRYHNTWLPEIQEVVSPLPADIMTNAQFEQTFYPIHAKDLKIGENYYGIPLMIDGMVLVYNNAILKQAGIQDPPAVWLGDNNDVLTVAAETTVREPNGEIITSGMAIGTATNIPHFGELYSILLLLNGGDFNDLSTTEAAEALELYRSFAEDGNWSSDMPNAIPGFAQGKVGMIVVPSWQILNIQAENPNLDMGVAPIPSGLDGTRASIASYWVEGVNRLNPNQAEAWKFLSFLSSREQLTKLYEIQSKTRIFGNPYPRQDMADLLINDKYLGAVIKQAKDDVYVTLPVAALTQDAGLNDEILQYLENAINSTIEGVEYSSALQTAQSGISQVMTRYEIER